MQVNPSSPAIAPQHRTQGGGTASEGGRNTANNCFLVRKEATVPQPKVAASACPIHPRIQQLLDEFPELLWPLSADHQPKHGLVHHILTDSRLVFAKARCL
jgi:hypothetical protein